MSSDIPDYYQHLMNTGDASDSPMKGSSADDAKEATSTPSDEERSMHRELYHADAFQMPLPSDAWRCETTYTLLGPVSRGMRHNITVTVERQTDCATLSDYAAKQMEPLESSLPECRLLVHGPLPLQSGDDAYRCIYRWHPEDQEEPLYQEQVYAFGDGVGYTLTASFRRDTRKEFGPIIEQVMRSFRIRSPEADARHR
ncbi:hypothetical protein [Longibacter sp.]|uniref:hypothetical protein n=1 Tax=Longibacter sp. TaxID=2045415 RepID=UPI003EBC28BA